MMYRRKNACEFEAGELDHQLIVKALQYPLEELFRFPDSGDSCERDRIMARAKQFYERAAKSLVENPDLDHLNTCELVERLKSRTGGNEPDGTRGRWGVDGRKDYYQIEDELIKDNSDAVASICYKRCLTDTGNGTSILDVRNYGEEFSLSPEEPFHEQPIAAGRLCTGFLVAPDTVATAAHVVTNRNLPDLCFIFDFKMTDAATVNIEVSNFNIYTATKIIHKGYQRELHADWVLVKLDREVEGHPVVTLSGQEIVPYEPVYVLGHPVGLPLKYCEGAEIRVLKDTHFNANLDIYMGNSGSPVFSSDTHEVLGIVVHGDDNDFRWTEEGWLSVVYPNPDYRSVEPQCTRVSQFRQYCQ